MAWIIAHPIPSIACAIMAGIILLIAWASCRVAGNADKQMEMMEYPAETDISDTLESLLGRPGVISMSAKEGQDLTVKVNPYKTEAGEQYSTVGPATIIVIPEDNKPLERMLK